MAKNNAIDIDIETGGGNTYTFPSATSTLATLALAETLTNKDLSAASNTLGSANVAAAGALMDSEVTNLAQVKAFDTTDYDPAGTDNSTDVTLAGTGTYLSLTGQEITVDPITESDISDLGTYSTDIHGNITALDAVTGINTGDEVAASTTAAGVIELATNVETDTGTATNRATTPANIASLGYTSNVGDVVGPASATDNAIARFDSTTGKIIQNSLIAITDAGAINTLGNQSWSIVRPDGTVNVSFLDEGYASASTSDSVNYFTITNGTTGSPLILSATGADTNISIKLLPKGTGRITDGTDDVMTTASTDTVTNKRINKRTSTTTSTTTLTPSPANYDVYTLTAQAADLTIANPTGTPVLGDTIAIYVTDDATARAISFGTQFKGFGAALPTTTTSGKTLLITAQYYDTNLWSVLSAVQQ